MHASVGLYETAVQLQAQFFEAFHPSRLHAVLHLVFSGCCRCPGPPGIWKHMDECGSDPLLEKTVCLLEKSVRLSGKPDYDIYPEKHLGGARSFHSRSDILYLVRERLGVVASSHLFQYGVGAGLERYVEMGEEFRAGSYPVHDLFCKKVGLDGGYPVSFYSVHFVQSPDKVEESLSGRLSEISGVHTCQNYFPDSEGRYFPGLCHCLRYRDASAFPPCIRDCAVGTFIVASVLYLQE